MQFAWKYAQNGQVINGSQVIKSFLISKIFKVKMKYGTFSDNSSHIIHYDYHFFYFIIK